MISQESIDEVLDRASLLDFSSELSGVKQHGGGIFSLCPFHQEKTGSFHIRAGGKFYHCFGCGASGNVFGFVMKVCGLSFPEAVEMVAQKYGITVKRTKLKKARPENRMRESLKKVNHLARLFFLTQAERSASIVDTYLDERSISRETRKQFELGFAPNEWHGLTAFLQSKGAPEQVILHSGLVKRNSRGELYDALRGRIVFPIIGVDRVLVGFGGRILPAFEDDATPKYLNSPETSLYHKSRVLYGLPIAMKAARYSKRIYVVEGYFDVISLAQAGVDEVVATCGTALTDGHVDLLKRSVSTVSVLFDGDTAGRDAAAKAFPGFINSGLEAEAVFLPTGEDPDSFARMHGEGLRKALEKTPAESLFDCFVEYESRKLGAKNANSLSPRQKAQVAARLGESLKGTKNPIEFDEYIKRGAYLLKTEAALLKELVGSSKNDRGQSVFREEPSSGEGSDNSQQKLSDFSHAHQVLLRSVMIRKEEALEDLKKLPEIYGNLPKTLILFCESFHEVLGKTSEEDGVQRNLVKDLLLAFGAEWVHFWKESYLMAEDPDVDSSRMFREAILRLREETVLASIQVLDASLAEGRSGDGEGRSGDISRENLLQARLDLSRKLQQLKVLPLESV